MCREGFQDLLRLLLMHNQETRRAVCRQVTVWGPEGFVTESRELVEELRCEITVNGMQQGVITCSPWDLEDAVTGWLWFRGLIQSADEIISMEREAANFHVTTRSVSRTCCEAAEACRLTPEEVIALSNGLEEESRLFRRTGGVHTAALARDGQILIRREDAGRHTAVDKALGACLRQKIPHRGLVLVFSGRVAGEIAQKAADMGCAAIIARSAPTDHACAITEQAGITLIGFARDDRFNIYTCPQRVTG